MSITYSEKTIGDVHDKLSDIREAAMDLRYFGGDAKANKIIQMTFEVSTMLKDGDIEGVAV